MGSVCIFKLLFNIIYYKNIEFLICSTLKIINKKLKYATSALLPINTEMSIDRIGAEICNTPSCYEGK